MKYVKQLLIILSISFVGELLNLYIPLPVPGSIYGMVILFIALLTGIIKLESVAQTGKFLIDIMPIMFIPAGVGLITKWSALREILLPVVIIIVVTNITVMVATGRLSQRIIRKVEKKND